jgi:DNA-binding beta-propeller fold protein YncE
MKSSITKQIAIGFLLLTAFSPGCVGQQSGSGQQSGGKLYISNFGDGSLLTYGNAASANGNQAPTQNVHDLNVQSFILDPTAVFVDTINDRLYVANTGINQILIYDNATTISGNAVPDRVISGAAAMLNAPRGLTVDTTRNILYVSNAGSNTILAFDVSNAAFTPSPICTVNGSTTTCNFTTTHTVTGLSQPSGL